MKIVTGTRKNSENQLTKGYIQGTEVGREAEKECMDTVEKIARTVYGRMMATRGIVDCDEFIQDCRIRVFFSREKYDESRAQVSTWIWENCKHVALGYRGKVKKLAGSEEDLDESKKDSDDTSKKKGVSVSIKLMELDEETQSLYASVPSPENGIIEKMMFQDCIRNLPENQGQAISLRSDGYSVQEIAYKMNVPVSTVNNWISRGKNKLLKMEGLAKAGPSVFLCLFSIVLSIKHHLNRVSKVILNAVVSQIPPSQLQACWFVVLV